MYIFIGYARSSEGYLLLGRPSAPSTELMGQQTSRGAAGQGRLALPFTGTSSSIHIISCSDLLRHPRCLPWLTRNYEEVTLSPYKLLILIT